MAEDQIETVELVFDDDGATPNNPDLALLLHKRAIETTGGDDAARVEAMFAANGWVGLWRDGVYPFHHYHSTCHEALGVASGWAEVRFGGEQGETVRLGPGDVAVLPAGTGHKRIEASDDFLIVGAYPPMQPYDLIRSDETGEHDAAVGRIAAVPIPPTDPVFGEGGGLKERWVKAG